MWTGVTPTMGALSASVRPEQKCHLLPIVHCTEPQFRVRRNDEKGWHRGVALIRRFA